MGIVCENNGIKVEIEDKQTFVVVGGKRYAAAQQPVYKNHGLLSEVFDILKNATPVVAVEEIEAARRQRAAVAEGKAFLVQAGACAQNLALSNKDTAENALALSFTMQACAEQITRIAGIPTVLDLREVGQVFKPRSKDNETIGGVVHSSYRGDGVNGIGFSAESRTPNPLRMLLAYEKSITGMNALRRTGAQPSVSHEALSVMFEIPMMRRHSSGNIYGHSACTFWIGDRTRKPDDAHVKLASMIANPIGLKCGPTLDPDELSALVKILDPNNEPGRLTLIFRMGAKEIGNRLPPLLNAVKKMGSKAILCCDPMHGNTVSVNGTKTRYLDAIMSEASQFVNICREGGVHPGGMHYEATRNMVTECCGAGVDEAVLKLNSRSLCDPRLNPTQMGVALHDLAQRLANSPSNASRLTRVDTRLAIGQKGSILQMVP